MRTKFFALILTVLAIFALGSCTLPEGLVSTTAGTTTAPNTLSPSTTLPSGTTAPITTAPTVTTEPTVTTTPEITTEPITTAPEATTETTTTVQGGSPDPTSPIFTRICTVCGQSLSIPYAGDNTEHLSSLLARLEGICSCEIRSYTDKDVTQVYSPYSYLGGAHFKVYASPIHYIGFSLCLVGSNRPIRHIATPGDVITGEDAAAVIPYKKVFVGFTASRDGSGDLLTEIPVSETTTVTTYYVVARAEEEIPPTPESVSVTIRSDIPMRPFYNSVFLSNDFVTEVTATFPRDTYVSEITYAFADTDDVNRKHYDVLSLRYHTAEGDLISKGAQLTEDTTIFIETELYYHYDVYFANQAWETFYAPLGSSISTVLADSRKGNLDDLLSSYCGSGYINLPQFYTDESRSAQSEVTTFTEDFTTLWTGIKEAPRLILVCGERCEGPHGGDGALWNGYVDSTRLSGHGYTTDLDGFIEITFYTDPECTIPYTEESPIYHTEDVTLYGKPVKEETSPTFHTLTVYCGCPACHSLGGSQTLSVSSGTMIGDVVWQLSHSTMIYVFEYYYDSGFTSLASMYDPITENIELYAYHPDFSGGTSYQIIVYCKNCHSPFGAYFASGTIIRDALSTLRHACAYLENADYYYDEQGENLAELDTPLTGDTTLALVIKQPPTPNLVVHCYYCDAMSPAIVNDGTKTIGELMSEYCGCDGPREYYLYDPSIEDYVGGFTEDSTVPTHYTELANDPIFSITVYCTCGTEPHINTANIRKKATVSELLFNYTDRVHPSTEYSIRFYLDEARTETPVEELEGYLRDHLVFYATCASEENPSHTDNCFDLICAECGTVSPIEIYPYCSLAYYWNNIFSIGDGYCCNRDVPVTLGYLTESEEFIPYTDEALNNIYPDTLMSVYVSRKP